MMSSSSVPFNIHNNDNVNKHNKIVLKSWWVEKDPSAVKIFDYLLSDVIHKYDKVVVHSVFGPPPTPKQKKPNTLYIQYSGEPGYQDPSCFDINFIPCVPNPRNMVLFPHAYYGIYVGIDKYNKSLEHSLFTEKRILRDHKDNFCVFLVSNPKNEVRNHMFRLLSSYKKVDSYGKYLNNTQNVPFEPEMVKKYKFFISFENNAMDYYFTEKLINAFMYGAIPIFWGFPQIREYINMDAIIYLPPNFTQTDVQRVMGEIVALDNDDSLYKKKYEQCLFKDGKIPDAFQLEHIKRQINLLCGV